MKISFAGCGFLGVYHIGVAKCLAEKAPEFVDSLEGFYGTSAGSLVAVMLCCRVGHDGGPRFAKKMSDLINRSWLGPFSTGFDPSSIIVRDLGRYLPPDAHKRASGKVRISVTSCADWNNVLISDFNTRRELINALVASCFIPLWSGWSLPKFRGKRMCDGGFTNNIPGSHDPSVITVSPYSGDCDICPQGECHPEQMVFATNTSFHLTGRNFQRLKESLFPPTWEKLELLLTQGYQDALRYLCSHGIVTKTVPSSLSTEECCHSNDYQILYELPLVAMTTITSGTLPSVAPVRAVLYKEITQHSLYNKLLSLPKSTICSLWYRCGQLLTNLSPWQLPLLLHLMKLLQFILKEAGIKKSPSRLLLTNHSIVMSSDVI